jgi:hypothetical protein
MLIFGVALLALMAGALFYAARIPVQVEAVGWQASSAQLLGHLVCTVPT